MWTSKEVAVLTKKEKTILLSFLALVILLGLIINEVNSKATFKELVIDQIGDSHGSQEIFSIRILKDFNTDDSKSIEIDDMETINKVMNVFKDIKLKRNNSAGPLSLDKNYWVTIQPDNGPTLDVIFTEDKIIDIHNSFSTHKKYSWTYEVVNDFDISYIKELLND